MWSPFYGVAWAAAQGNQINSGAASATGNAPAWFPGSEGAHVHAASLSGFKSQSLEASQTGTGDHGGLVFDDTGGQGRVQLHTTNQQTQLQMGHLLQQYDNQRLWPCGHGLASSVPGRDSPRMYMVLQHYPAGMWRREIDKLKGEVDGYITSRGPNFQKHVAEVRLHAWDRFDKYIDTQGALGTFKRNGDNFQGRVVNLIESHVGQAIHGMGASAAGAHKLERWVARSRPP